MRGKALVSLGLCCLIAKNMALSSFQLFLNQAQNAPAELKVEVLKVIMDLLILYDDEFFGKSEETVSVFFFSDFFVDFLLYRRSRLSIFCCRLWKLKSRPRRRRL